MDEVFVHSQRLDFADIHGYFCRVGPAGNLAFWAICSLRQEATFD